MHLFVTPVAFLVSLSTAAGVFLHDMQVDKAASVALSLPPTVALTYDSGGKLATFSPDLHTHIERSAYSQTINELNSRAPRLQARLAEDKKHFLQKRLARGHHAFDNYNLPLVS